MTSPDALAAELRRRNLRVTAPRLAVYRAVAELDGHPDVDTIAGHTRASLGTVSVQAVYDSLAALTEVGLLRRIQPAGSPARYETRVGDNHHHLICRACGRVVDVDCRIGAAPCLTPAADMGYEIDEAEVAYWGRCPECVARDHSSARSAPTTAPRRNRPRTAAARKNPPA